MKYLITGASGQLAKKFIEKLSSQDIYFYEHSKLDISDEKALKECIDSIKPSIIINCAAYNNVDKAEGDYEKAYNINAIAVGNIAKFSHKHKALLIHFSTDYVFDGLKNEPYTEVDIPNPINKYALSKLEGERLLSENTDNYLIFRVSWVYGNGMQNFIYKFLSWTKSRNEISVSVDEVSVPTYTGFIVENVLKSIKNELRGLWHLVPNGYTSRYQWAEIISKILNINIKLNKAYQSDFKLPAKRPNFSALNSKRLSNELSMNFDNWEKYLYDFLKNYNIKEIL